MALFSISEILNAMFNGTTNAVSVTAGGNLAVVALEKTRPNDTTPYAIYDLINESASAGTSWALAAARSGGPGTGVVTGFLLQTSHAANVAQCEIDVFNADTAALINDNAEGTHLYANSGKLLQTITLPLLAKRTTNSDMAEAYADCAVVFSAAVAPNLYLRLRTLTAFTPTAQSTYKITAFVAQD